MKIQKDLRQLLIKHLKDCEVNNYAKRTIQGRRSNIGYLLDWCEAQKPGLTLSTEITPGILDAYKAKLYAHKKSNGEKLNFNTQLKILSDIRNFFKWLVKKQYLIYNPASELELPRVDKRLPKVILTHEEAELVIFQADINTKLGIRDRSILETFYSTGMRRSELRFLKLYDLDFDRGTVMVRNTKNKRDRVIPIGARALKWIKRYLEEVRPSLLRYNLPDEDYLFLTKRSRPLKAHYVTELVREAVLNADIGKTGSCHLFRHTMATLMLENGADVRYVQEMLGHVTIESTQIYTHVSIKKLKEVHTKSHPARL